MGGPGDDGGIEAEEQPAEGAHQRAADQICVQSHRCGWPVLAGVECGSTCILVNIQDGSKQVTQSLNTRSTTGRRNFAVEALKPNRSARCRRGFLARRVEQKILAAQLFDRVAELRR